ncbi:subtilisin-like protease SBT1.7 [Dioscorea cayenensis subsp. rotundata]|uniref:Subtilisin-like protease SBT1.7 n=1 Tax=Dioscorea cayennensis subsp. rotundata TaxID=55577 RepID=A0AB40CC90_DIOCR|nr:subtilisin-like protease SBT1.7 [Dioscorea cayenensis subsp. rotundata]
MYATTSLSVQWHSRTAVIHHHLVTQVMGHIVLARRAEPQLYDAGVLGQAKGMAVGTAPKAHLSVYKVVFEGRGWDSDFLAGIDQAIRDGVHVLSMSLGSGPKHFHESGIAVSSFLRYNSRNSSLCCSGK